MKDIKSQEEYLEEQLNEFCEKHKELINKLQKQAHAIFLFGNLAKKLCPKLFENE
jgi:vacuolar-type H+-ATPase subunit H